MKNYVDLLKREGQLPSDSEWITAKNLTSRYPRTLWNHPVSERIRKFTGTDIKAQFWMQDNARLTFEFALGNREGIDIGSEAGKKIVEIRELIASHFKEFVISKHPPECIGLSKRSGSTVANIRIKDEGDIPNLTTSFQFLSKALAEWHSTNLLSLLNKVNGIGAGIEKQRIGLEADEADAEFPDQNEAYELQETDRRSLVDRQIRERRGQAAFRNSLRNRYGDRCLVTGCEVLAVLEAAHISPYRGKMDNHPENGLLLRTDIHTLFDLNLLGVEPTSLRIELHPEISKEYGEFAGRSLTCGQKNRPSQDALRLRYDQFIACKQES